jgi:hypothetical protein
VSAHNKSRLHATENEPRAYIRWINGRAYAELGGWAAWGGRRQEPLRGNGEKYATDNPNTAAILLAQRIRELRERRAAEDAAAVAEPVPTSIASFIGYHLACKAHVVNRRGQSERELNLLRTRLIHAGKFFLRQGVRDLRELTRGVVVAYMEHLQEEVGNAPGHAGRRVDYLSPATQRKYLLALGNMLKRARSNGIIHTNFVADVLAADNC